MKESETMATLFVAATYFALMLTAQVYREVNATRDKIISGRDGAIVLGYEHRKILFTNDWLPFKFGIAVIFLMAGVMILRLPESMIRGLGALQVLAAIPPFTSGVSFLTLGIRDGVFIADVLTQAKAEAHSTKRSTEENHPDPRSTRPVDDDR